MVIRLQGYLVFGEEDGRKCNDHPCVRIYAELKMTQRLRNALKSNCEEKDRCLHFMQ